MIVDMANILYYDIYDLELTQVKNNTELRKLLIATTNKSIIVIALSISRTARRRSQRKMARRTRSRPSPTNRMRAKRTRTTK